MSKKLIQKQPKNYPVIDYQEAFEECYRELGNIEPWQIQMAHVLMLPKAMRPPKEKTIADLGLGNETNYNNWARHPKLQAIKKVLTKRYFKDTIPDILLAMQNQALLGDVAAAKLFLSYVDDYDIAEQKQIFNQVNVTPDQLTDILSNLKNKQI